MEITILLNNLLIILLSFLVYKNIRITKSFMKFYKFRHKLKDTLEATCENTISIYAEKLRTEHYSSFGERLNSIMVAGRNATIDFSKIIYETQIKVDEKFLNNELSRIFDSLKISTNSFFKELKYINFPLDDALNIKTLATYYRDCSKIKKHMEVLIIQLIEIKSGKYNGHSDNKFIDNVNDFMKKVMIEGFEKAMEFDKLKTFLEIKK